MTKEEIHQEAKERFQEIMDYEGRERNKMQDDKEFGLGENDAQWDSDDRNSRQADGRSFLTIMRSNQFTDHVKNKQRQNKPSVKISPTDEGAQEKVATRRQGLVRHIQYESKASQARQAGFADSVEQGRGHWIVKTEFVEGTFNKKIIIEPIPDALSVYMDIRRDRPDYSDCKHGFIVKTMSRKAFEEKHPDATSDNWDGNSNFWYTEKDVTIVEYYVEEYKTRKLLEVEEDGETKIIYEDEIEEELTSKQKIINSRTVEDPVWMWYKMTGSEIIDDEKLPWKEIPIITCIGKETRIDGRWSCKGQLRDIKAPLRLYNFISSNEADIIAKAPRSPWVGAEGQFEGHEQEYADSNTSDVPYLEYKPVSIGGQMAPPPQRAQFSVDLHNITQQKASIIEDIKAITGIYDASIGNRSNETSGVAIKRREAQGDNANYHFIDNFVMAIAHEGRVINSALNVIYDTDRTVTIMGDDDEEELLKINGPDDPGLGDGNFSVTVSVGPSFNTQREEQAAGMLEMLNAVPLVQNTATDLVVRTQDWMGKDTLADRLEFAIEKQIPGITTQVKPDDEGDEIALLQQQLQQAQQQIQQSQMQMQQLQQALEKSQADKNAADAQKQQNAMQELKIKSGELKLKEVEIKGRLSIEEKKIELEGMKADLESETKLKISGDSLEVDLIKDANQNVGDRVGENA